MDAMRTPCRTCALVGQAGAPDRSSMQNHAMDDIVKQAMSKWPNVPHCYGWLGLDERGRWFMRDDATQAKGPFRQNKGSLLSHEKLIEFIGRNYEADAQGQWYFQNGPQRVYVELESTPWIWRIQPDQTVVSHTGRAAQVEVCLLDEDGRVYLVTDIGFGLVHTMDVASVVEAVEQGRWRLQNIQDCDLADRYGFVLSPAAKQVRKPDAS